MKRPELLFFTAHRVEGGDDGVRKILEAPLAIAVRSDAHQAAHDVDGKDLGEILGKVAFAGFDESVDQLVGEGVHEGIEILHRPSRERC